MRKSTKPNFFVFFLILLIALFSSQNDIQYNHANTKMQEDFSSYTPFESIIIHNDSTFTDYGFPGNGSSNNPFIIENYYISTSQEYGIDIEFTDMFFVIRNCYINADQTAINIEEVGIANTKIINNTCIGNYFLGIRIFDAPAAVIQDNTCINSRDGIHIHSSPFVSIVNNTCSNNFYDGINIEYSSKVSLRNNTFDSNNYIGVNTRDCSLLSLENNTISNNNRWGLYLFMSVTASLINNTVRDNEFMNRMDMCTGSIIKGNNFTNDGLAIEDWNTTEYLTYTVEDNLVNDKLFGFFVNLNKHSFLEPIYGQFTLVNCTEVSISNQIIANTDRAFFIVRCKEVTLHDNICENNEAGVRVYYSSNIFISENVFSNTTHYGIWLIESTENYLSDNRCDNIKYYGIHLLGSDNNILIGNKCNNNTIGIYVEGSDDCIFTYTMLRENEKHGIQLTSFCDNNLIHHNYFKDNNLDGVSQAKDDGNNNTWWDPNTKQGNHWSNWNKRKPYLIEGRSNSTDPYPLNEGLNNISLSFFLLFPTLLVVTILNKHYKKRKR